LSAALQASFGASFPQLVAAFNNGLTGLAQLGQNLAANLAAALVVGCLGLFRPARRCWPTWRAALACRGWSRS